MASMLNNVSKIYSIEGNIGSGKSTIIKFLKEHFKNNDNIIFLLEPVDEWNTICDNDKTIIEKYYQDKKKIRIFISNDGIYITSFTTQRGS